LILVSSAWLIVNTPVFYSIIPQLGMMCIITGVACWGRFRRRAGGDADFPTDQPAPSCAPDIYAAFRTHKVN